ncbi:hypothetical protein KC460_00545 [Candidatus Dependentiae bacterium]|nr:hypothetical protein [Candidatus Dependentiae bacterium]
MQQPFLFYIIFLFLVIVRFINTADNFTITLEPTWKNLEQRKTKNIRKFGGKWILAGSITFKKKAKDTVTLGKIYLQWHGPTLENVVGSLYKKKPDKDFLPIEENILTDGKWNKKKQTLMFNFPSYEYLGAVNTFYVVLTIPPDREHHLKNGHFSLEKRCLPGPYRECIYNNKLAFNKNLFQD